MVKKYFIKSIIIIILMFFHCIHYLFSYKTKIKLGNIKMKGLNLKWTKEQLEIKNQILKGNYIDGHGNYIEITKDNICLDGHHRLSVLKQVKPTNYEITVIKLWIPNIFIPELWSRLIPTSYPIIFNIIKRLSKHLNP